MNNGVVFAHNPRVIRVIDGDTVEIDIVARVLDVDVRVQPKIRLLGVDTPETKGIEHDLGVKARDWMKGRLEGQEIEIDVSTKDTFGRWLGVIYHQGENVNELLIAEGLAERYSPKKHNDGVLEIEKKKKG